MNDHAPPSEITCAVSVIIQNRIKDRFPELTAPSVELLGRSIAYDLEPLLDSASNHLKKPYITRASKVPYVI